MTDKRDLIQEFLDCEDRVAFVESLSIEEREELHLLIDQIINVTMDNLRSMFDLIETAIQHLTEQWIELCEMAGIALDDEGESDE